MKPYIFNGQLLRNIEGVSSIFLLGYAYKSFFSNMSMDFSRNSFIKSSGYVLKDIDRKNQRILLRISPPVSQKVSSRIASEIATGIRLKILLEVP